MSHKIELSESLKNEIEYMLKHKMLCLSEYTSDVREKLTKLTEYAQSMKHDC